VKRLLFVLMMALVVLLSLSQCGVKQEGKNDAPAGNPDELKDSTRLDPAPDTTHKAHESQGPQ
jgi:hypothetical protein